MATEFTRLVEGRAKLSTDVEDQSVHSIHESTVSSRKVCCGDWLKSVSFGGFDGVIAALVIIFGKAGCGMNDLAYYLGFAYLGGSAAYVALSEFLSAKAHRDFLLAERRRAVWEFKHFKDQEMKEMELRFIAKGMSRKDAESVVLKLSGYENVFVGLMASEELGQQLPHYSEESSVLLVFDAILIAFSYAVFGSLTLFANVACDNLIDIEMSLEATFGIAAVLLSIFSLIKSSYGSGKWCYAIFEALLFGAVCSFIAFHCGRGFVAMYPPY